MPEINLDEKELQHSIQADDSSLENNSKPILLDSEPVITTGQDVSRFVVDIRDDEDTALTFRSIFLGTIFAGLSASLYQVSNFNFLHNDGQHCCKVQIDTNHLW